MDVKFNFSPQCTNFAINVPNVFRTIQSKFATILIHLNNPIKKKIENIKNCNLTILQIIL